MIKRSKTLGSFSKQRSLLAFIAGSLLVFIFRTVNETLRGSPSEIFSSSFQRSSSPSCIEQQQGNNNIFSSVIELATGSSSSSSTGTCFQQYDWINPTLDYHYKPAIESAKRSKQSTQDAVAAMNNITWVEGYHPGHDLVTLKLDETSGKYVMIVEEQYRPNQPHKKKCILEVLQRAFQSHEPEIRQALHGKELKFVVCTEDFGMIWRSSNSKLPTFSLSTDDDHIDIPVPDFTFGCYPEATYTNTSWPAIAQLLKTKSDMLSWKDRKTQIFHRSHFGVGPRQKLMPLLSDLHNKGKDEELFGAQLNVADTGFITSNRENFVWLDHMCDYKYQLHTSGFSYSAALKYKLACGSLVFKLESKYREFYEYAIKDGVHYVGLTPKSPHEDTIEDEPFLKNEAPKIKQAVVATKDMDTQPDIAKQGQEWALFNLSPAALDCYWLGAILRYAEIYHS